jgi:hypothetical protein
MSAMVAGWLWGARVFLFSFLLSGAVLAAVVALFRNAIASWLTAKTKHHYDAALEEIRNSNTASLEEMKAGFARDLEALKAELAAKGKEVEALRSASLGARAARQAIISKRRLEAVDQIWAAVKALGQGKALASFMAVIKFEAAAKRAERDPRAKELFSAVFSGFKLEQPVEHQAHEARPFVSPAAWGLFSAYQGAISLVGAQAIALKTGVGPDMVKKPDDVLAVLVSALPEWKQTIETYQIGSFPHVLDEIEKRLLVELQISLDGKGNDEAEVERAAHIIELSRDSEIRHAEAAIPPELRSDPVATKLSKGGVTSGG